MCLFSTGFVRAGIPYYGLILHAAACLTFSLQIAGIAIAIRLFSGGSVPFSAAWTSVFATVLEMIQAYFGVTWAVTNPMLTMANTPVAQWLAILPPFCLSTLLYFVNFLLALDRSKKQECSWRGPVFGVSVLFLLWIGGFLLASKVSFQPLKFTAMLVQPHLPYSIHEQWRPWLKLDELTMSSLDENGSVDLIVWPETCLSESVFGEGESSEIDVQKQMTLSTFSQTMQLKYATNCLVGVAVTKKAVSVKYGLPVSEVDRFNCGCLISPSGLVDCHEKTTLVPFTEGVPEWLDFKVIRQFVLPVFGCQAPYKAGRGLHRIPFHDQSGTLRTIVVAVCFESWHPWLLQYHQEKRVDAIVHLIYDGDFVNHPELIERQVLSCRLRAIETRTWNLVCSNWSGSAIIDPCGSIVCQLPAQAGVLRSNLNPGVKVKSK